MQTTRRQLVGGSSARFIALMVSITTALMLALPAAMSAQDESAEPEVDQNEAICETASNLRLIAGFLQDTSISEDGVIPVVVGGIAGVSQARQLAGLVGETLQPLAEDLVVSLQGLRDLGDEMTDDQTLGAKVAIFGESIVEIGESMDALGLQLRERCPGA